TTPWWIADNGSGRTTLYNVGTGAIQAIFTVPGAGGQQGTPTGVVFNGGTGFVETNSGGTSPARFIFAAQDGTISGFRGAPLVIRHIGGTIYVTYPLQDADKHDDVPGEGHGFVNAFDTAGNLLRRVASKGQLNSPWGLALAPADFGSFCGDLLVGNFGNCRI